MYERNFKINPKPIAMIKYNNEINIDCIALYLKKWEGVFFSEIHNNKHTHSAPSGSNIREK